MLNKELEKELEKAWDELEPKICCRWCNKTLPLPESFTDPVLDCPVKPTFPTQFKLCQDCSSKVDQMFDFMEECNAPEDWWQ